MASARLLILGLFWAGLIDALRFVVEHRQEIETRIQTLAKRNDVCTGYLRGRGDEILTTTCVDGHTCCYGTEEELAACIPSDAVCCEFGSFVSWCPSSQDCNYVENTAFVFDLRSCIDRTEDEEEPTYYDPTSEEETWQVSSSSSTDAQESDSSHDSGSSPLSTGSIIGIAVSAGCSVLGLIFTVGFKIWKHRRKQQDQADS